MDFVCHANKPMCRYNVFKISKILFNKCYYKQVKIYPRAMGQLLNILFNVQLDQTIISHLKIIGVKQRTLVKSFQ